MLETIQYDDNLPVKVQLLNIQKYPWHTHNDIQIVYIINGEVELKMTYARYHLVKNNMHFIHSQDVHGFRSVTSNNMVLILSLKMDYFTKYFPDLDTQVFTTKVSENIATYKKQLALKAHIFSIISEIHEKKKGYEGRVKEISHSLLEALYKDFRGFTVDVEKRTFEHQVSHDPVQADRISRVVSFVYQNYPYKLGLADRLQTVYDFLSRLGADITDGGSGLSITGQTALNGGTVSGHNDHRIVMAAAVASCGCTQPVIIQGAEAVNKSYPEFFKDFAALGGEVYEV